MKFIKYIFLIILLSIPQLSIAADGDPVLQPGDGFCLESIFGDAIEADDFVKTGTTLTLQAEIPHTDAAETITGAWAFSTWNLTALTSEPTEVVGRIYRADNDTWDPCGIAGTDDYFVICTAADTYIALWDISGNFYFSSIRAAMGLITKAANYTLTAPDMNGIVVVTATAEIQIPADQCDTATGKWITVKQTGAFAVDIAFLDASDDAYLSDGTAVEGTTNEIQTAGAAGNQVTLVCLEANKWWITGEIGTCTSEAAD